jgi:APA family basic amino acid/polyamine antiporter
MLLDSHIIFYVLGLIPILSGLNIAQVASMSLIIGGVLRLILNIFLVRLPKVVPDLWEKSKYRVSTPLLYVISVVSVAAGGVTIALTISRTTPFLMVCNGGMLIFSFLYCIIRKKSGKVNMEKSYEAT